MTGPFSRWENRLISCKEEGGTGGLSPARPRTCQDSWPRCPRHNSWALSQVTTARKAGPCGGPGAGRGRLRKGTGGRAWPGPIQTRPRALVPTLPAGVTRGCVLRPGAAARLGKSGQVSAPIGVGRSPRSRALAESSPTMSPRPAVQQARPPSQGRDLLLSLWLLGRKCWS